MEKAKLNVVRFSDNDVITTSGFLKLSGFGDNNSTNQTMEYNGIIVNSASGKEAWENMFSEASGGATDYRFTDGSKSMVLTADNVKSINKDGNSFTFLNGSFVYDSTYVFKKKTGYFVKQ